MPPTSLTRRRFLASSTFGVGCLALAWLLNEDSSWPRRSRPELEPHNFDLTPKSPHFAPRARAMISLFMQGGPSHIDLLDPKPVLAKYDGKPFPGDIKYDNAAEASSKVLASPWKFAKHGQCGIEVSELLPHLAEVVDDITRHPLDAHRRQQSRPVDPRPEHRLDLRRPAGPGQLAYLRPGLGEPEPAGLRRPDRPDQPAGRRRRQLVQRLAAVACTRARRSGRRSRAS